MNGDPILLLRFFFILCFLGTAFVGVMVLKNYERLFGNDPDAPSETSSGRTYGKMQALAVIAHALLLFGALILML
jgi:hypothetical protein